MEYLQDIILDLNSNTAYTTIGAKQGDSGSRKVRVHLTKNGDEFIIPDEAIAYFRFKKPDGKVVINSAEIENNCVIIELSAQTLMAAGRGYADIVLQKGSSILSTVSFILIIMASPQISNEVESSDEFGYLNAIITDANNTIYEAEAWACGNRGGVACPSTNVFDHAVGPSIGTALSSTTTVDSETFFKAVGHASGLFRTYTFTYNDNEAWELQGEIIDGTVITNTNSIVTTNAIGVTYGISLEYIQEASAPNLGDWVEVHIEEPDITFENNAKYYAEAAASSLFTAVRYVEQPDLRSNPSAQEIARINIGAQASGNYIINPSEKSNGQYLTYNGNNWDATTLPTYILEPVEKDEGQFLVYDSDGWIASSLNANTVGAIPALLDSRFYGTSLPTDGLEEGRIFFLYSSTPSNL